MQDHYIRRGRPRIVGIERRRPDQRPDPDDESRKSRDEPDSGEPKDA
jgi:hypothetical protein